MASVAYTHTYTHTHTHTLADESDYKKPDALACAPGLKNQRINLLVTKEALIGEHNLKPLLIGHRVGRYQKYQDGTVLF